jgi:hypothetical protein
MKKIIVAILGLSITLLADFSRDGSIVTDSATGLQWQDDAVGDTMTWREAISHCEDDVSLGGHDDWRLPNINELKTIINRGRYNPAIVSAFKHTSSSDYWSSTTNEYDREGAWGAYFGNGNVYDDGKGNNGYVRCVRDGQ